MKRVYLLTFVIFVSDCVLSFADSMKEEALQSFLQAANSGPPKTPPTAVPKSDIPPIFVHEPKADETPPVSAKAKIPTEAVNAPEATVVLPGIEITSSPIKDLGRDLEKHDDAVKVESKYAKPETLDSIINDKKISLPKRFFGGENAEVRAGAAQRRLELMELERKVIIAMDTAKTAEEKRSLRILLGDIQAMVRDLSL